MKRNHQPTMVKIENNKVTLEIEVTSLLQDFHESMQVQEKIDLALVSFADRLTTDFFYRAGGNDLAEHSAKCAEMVKALLENTIKSKQTNE
jgi:hypothetical protein